MEEHPISFQTELLPSGDFICHYDLSQLPGDALEGQLPRCPHPVGLPPYLVGVEPDPPELPHFRTLELPDALEGQLPRCPHPVGLPPYLVETIRDRPLPDSKTAGMPFLLCLRLQDCEHLLFNRQNSQRIEYFSQFFETY